MKKLPECNISTRKCKKNILNLQGSAKRVRPEGLGSARRVRFGFGRTCSALGRPLQIALIKIIVNEHSNAYNFIANGHDVTHSNWDKLC